MPSIEDTLRSAIGQLPLALVIFRAADGCLIEASSEALTRAWDGGTLGLPCKGERPRPAALADLTLAGLLSGEAAQRVLALARARAGCSEPVNLDSSFGVVRGETPSPWRLAPLGDSDVFMLWASPMDSATDATGAHGWASTRDSLTGLADRAALMKYLTARFDPAGAADVPDEGARSAVVRPGDAGAGAAALLFVDLDRFKVINDRHGHMVGDDLLRSLAEKMTRALRPGDLLVRYGGDEFVVVAEGLSSADDAVRIAERLLAVLREPLEAVGTEVVVGASIGIALLLGDRWPSRGDTPPHGYLASRGGSDAAALIDAADRAMYRAKAAGGNCWQWADDGSR